MAAGITSMDAQVESLPELVGEILPRYAASARTRIGTVMAAAVRQVYVLGCGDSHMAAVGSELAFWTLAGLPCRAATALHFARYIAPHLQDDGGALVIGVSVSGQVARTVEALRMARRVGARTLAVTGDASSRLALSAQCVFPAVVPAMATPAPSPGVRSYMASLAALYLLAVRLGEARGFLTPQSAASARDELRSLPRLQAEAIRTGTDRASAWLAATEEIHEFVFLGAGPAYGVALFGAAKMLEGSGDSACGQDLEEWAHLQYFAKDVATPTVVIDCGGAGYSRACEVAQAARAIGRRVVAVVPADERCIAGIADATFPVPGALREEFAPLLYSVPLMCLASERARLLRETPYRGFGGGRSKAEGGGASRVQSSALLPEVDG
ncbi:MAG: Glutamine--fructose-6-phosphate aminotransferase (isomerizing) [Chloroflexi bacterium ADurb.Bin180]|nr:MAG: Glutamine--fructose-6-phosphate aminotransferase (isomerizing) [Chloroflexi bacterium ADurb.Bin180]